MYLLKSKDEALYYFKTCKAELENQLERKIKWLRSDRGGEYFQVIFLIFVWNMVLFMRGHRHSHHNPMGLLKGKSDSNRFGECHVEYSGIIQGMVG